MFKKAPLNILSLFSSSFVGQLIHIVALPYLSFYFKHEEIGAFFLFQAVVIMCTIFISLQSEQAIVVESNENSYETFKKSIIIISLLSIFSFIVVSQLSFVFELFIHKSTISLWINFVPLMLFIFGSNSSMEYLWTFEKKFRLISAVRIMRPLFIYISIFSLKILKPDFVNLLIVGFIVGNGIIFIYQVFLVSKIKRCRFNPHDFSPVSFKMYFKKHKKILIFNTLSTGILTASLQVPYLYIAAVFGEVYSAYYGMAMRIVGMPLSLLGQSVGQVYFQKFSLVNYHKHNIIPFVKRMVYRTYAIGIIPFLLLMLFLPELFHLFIGKGWDTAVLLSRVLLPWLFVSMVSAPVSNVPSVLGIQNKIIFFDVVIFISRILGLLICWKLNLAFISTMVIFSAIGFIVLIAYQYLVLSLSKRYYLV